MFPGDPKDLRHHVVQHPIRINREIPAWIQCGQSISHPDHSQASADESSRLCSISDLGSLVPVHAVVLHYKPQAGEADVHLQYGSRLPIVHFQTPGTHVNWCPVLQAQLTATQYSAGFHGADRWFRTKTHERLAAWRHIPRALICVPGFPVGSGEARRVQIRLRLPFARSTLMLGPSPWSSPVTHEMRSESAMISRIEVPKNISRPCLRNT